jgi:putative hydrolase of the HAD superfamily
VTKAVLFDLDDTLFDHTHCAREALEAIRTGYACFTSIAPDALARTHTQILDELHPQVTSGTLKLDAARQERFRRLFESAGFKADAAQAADASLAYRRRYEEAWKEVAGASALLAAVRKRDLRIGVVSNNLLKEQEDKLRCCRLDQYVDALVVSGDVGVSKPDPRIFEIALEKLRCAPEESVMVGDAWDADIEGALAAGIRPVWLNRGGRQGPRADGNHVSTITALEPTSKVLSTILTIRTTERV